MENTGKIKSEYKRFSIRFLDRSIRFLVYSSAALTVLYFSGSMHDFLDVNLSLILNAATAFYILLALFSFAAILVKTVYIFLYREKKYITLYIVDFFLFLVSTSLSFSFLFVTVTIKGNI